jgi:tyrosyl-tRNA synthetase
MNKKLFHQVSDENFFSEKNGKFYLGIDPTGFGIHIGHLIPIKLALTLLENNFEGILLIGGFTGKIGDPTDKNEARKKLEENEAKNYSQFIFDDINRIFEPYKNKITFVNNKDWLEKMTFSDYLSLSYHISIVKKLHLETFDKRLKENLTLSAAEFLYPDIQMIDFLHLCNNFDCNIQIGGSDQWGNISFGVHYVKKITKRDDIFGLCAPLLTSNNKKISKSEGKPAFIKDPFAIYQFCIRLNDETLMQMCEIFAPELNTKDDPKTLRKNIAKAVLKIGYPNDYEKIYEKVENESEQIFFKNVNEIYDEFFFEKESQDLISLINFMDSSISKSEIKRKMSEGAITLNEKKISENINLEAGKYKIKIGSKIVFLVKIIS